MITQKILEDGQKMIDSGELFEFNEIEGKVKLIDGVAAGEPYYGFEFVDGPLAGKKIYCARVWDDGFEYGVNESSDGMEFNVDPEKKTEETDDWGGDYLPELTGKTLTVKEDAPGIQTLSELIKSLEAARDQVGDIQPLVEWSIGARDSWPVLHVAFGQLDDGTKYCEITTGLKRGTGDADSLRMAEEMAVAASMLQEVEKA